MKEITLCSRGFSRVTCGNVVSSAAVIWVVTQRFSPTNWKFTDSWLVSELTIGNAKLVHSVIFTWTLDKGKQMGFGFKQPLVGGRRCVTTQITAAEETSGNAPEKPLTPRVCLWGFSHDYSGLKRSSVRHFLIKITPLIWPPRQYDQIFVDGGLLN